MLACFTGTQSHNAQATGVFLASSGAIAFARHTRTIAPWDAQQTYSLPNKYRTARTESTTKGRTAVASYAEWIAKSIWDSRLRPIRSEAPATRLTQRQRSDGRAKLQGLDETNSSRLALCRICGQIRLGSNSICRDCMKAATGLPVNRPKMPKPLAHSQGQFR